MDALLDDYRRYAVEHGKHTLEGDAEATNAAYDHLQDAFVALVRAGEGEKLFGLYDDSDPWGGRKGGRKGVRTL
jgi:hypothetical protein